MDRPHESILNCTACGAPTTSSMRFCPSCGAERPMAAAAPGLDKDEVWEVVPIDSPPADDVGAGLIPYKNPQALSSYYLGFFALIPLIGILFAPVAVVLGLLGLRYSRQSPEAKGGVHAVIGLVLGGLSLFCNPAMTFLLWKL